MGITIGPKAPNWKSQRFDSSDTFVVPTRLVGGVVYVTGTGAGGGGCSGGVSWNSSTFTTDIDDYSSGGSGGLSCNSVPLAVTAGESLSVVIGTAGAGGAAQALASSGAVNGAAGAAATATLIYRSGVDILTLLGGTGGTWATSGGGLASTPGVAAGVSNGGDGADEANTTAEWVGVQPAGTEGSDMAGGSQPAHGGHAGGASGHGKGGDGGDGAYASAASVTADSGEDGLFGGGGGGGGTAVLGTGAGFTATSGAGGDGGASYLVIEWIEQQS